MMSAEQKLAQSEKMRKRWADKKAAQAAVTTDDSPALKEALAKAPLTSGLQVQSGPVIPIAEMPDPVPIPEQSIAETASDDNHISVEVDWQKIPMREAQEWYAYLKAEFEKAGKILNARSMERVSGYTCFMCKKHFEGMPGFTDHSYVDPKTGLSPRVDCCGELCVIRYNEMRINQRHQRDILRAAEERGG